MQYLNSFRNLIVWKEAKILTLQIYKITENFPKHEMYSITNQLRRASSSVIANIAEGNERKTKADKLNFFTIARSSLAETDCFLELALDLNYLTQEQYGSLVNQLNKTAYLLAKFIASFDE